MFCKSGRWLHGLCVTLSVCWRRDVLFLGDWRGRCAVWSFIYLRRMSRACPFKLRK